MLHAALCTDLVFLPSRIFFLQTGLYSILITSSGLCSLNSLMDRTALHIQHYHGVIGLPCSCFVMNLAHLALCVSNCFIVSLLTGRVRCFLTCVVLTASNPGKCPHSPTIKYYLTFKYFRTLKFLRYEKISFS